MLKLVAVMAVVVCVAAPAMALSPADPETAANVTLEQVKAALAAATPEHPADFSGKSLRKLDLSKLNFTGAKLTGANLFSAKLEGANMTRADLTGANLNLAWIIHANFTDASLRDASLVAPIVAEGMTVKAGEVPIFKGVDLSGARVQARFTGGDLRGAKFGGADLSAHLQNQSMGLLHTEMGSANLEGADFSKANMGHVDLSFANVKGANFEGADLSRADLTGADARDARFSGADLAGTELHGAHLDGAKGLDSAKNLDQARGYVPGR
ncbi:MAG: pentapeptide repeat-containing protein [Beijerinckiaceae bacterium]|nr:pentapeptide repeat-containing protein [Beijerinckiaceae bacterium]